MQVGVSGRPLSRVGVIAGEALLCAQVTAPEGLWEISAFLTETVLA